MVQKYNKGATLNVIYVTDDRANLELLYLAFRETRDSSFYYAANSHAEITLKNHFREDNSSYHVVSFDTITGEVMKKNTHQGYSDESAWARGQAWGLYGFAMVYRETGDVPINYADYYFLEANLRRMKMNGNWKGEKANVIIKADDLTFDSEEVVNSRWQAFADLAVAYEIKVSPGIIGRSWVLIL